MPYKTSLTFDNDILTCTVHGERSASESLKMWRDLISITEKHPVNYILLDLHLSGRLLPTEILSSVQKLTQKLPLNKFHVLLVDNNLDSFHDNYLASILAQEQKIQVQIFNTKEEALYWLENQ